MLEKQALPTIKNCWKGLLRLVVYPRLLQKEKGNRDAQTGFPFNRPTGRSDPDMLQNESKWFENCFC